MSFFTQNPHHIEAFKSYFGSEKKLKEVNKDGNLHDNQIPSPNDSGSSSVTPVLRTTSSTDLSGYKEGTYKLGAKLPWHYITRPALYIHILHFRHHILVRLICTGEKTVEFTFEQETGKLLDSARQLVTVWPITNDSELSLNIKYAHSLLVRYGVNPKRRKK